MLQQNKSILNVFVSIAERKRNKIQAVAKRKGLTASWVIEDTKGLGEDEAAALLKITKCLINLIGLYWNDKGQSFREKEKKNKVISAKKVKEDFIRQVMWAFRSKLSRITGKKKKNELKGETCHQDIDWF